MTYTLQVMNWERIKHIVLGDFDRYTLREKYLITIPMVACLGNAPAIYFNLHFNSVELSIVSLITTFFFFFSYLIIRLYKLYGISSWIVLFNAMVLGTFSWILFEGSRGSATPILMIILIYCFLIFESWQRVLAASISILQLSVLLYVEYQYPHVLRHYENDLSRLMDIFVTFILSAFVIVYFLLTLLKFYTIEKEHAKRASSLKTIFLSNMSHDIRTPLNGILGFASILKEENVPKEMEQKYLNIISDSGKQLLELVNDIIDLSKIESNRLDFNIETTEVISLMYTAFEFHENSRYKSEAVNLKLDIPEGLNEFYLKTDPVRFLQIINNLLTNALKNTKKGFVEFGIQDPNTSKNSAVTFHIKDSGIGIPEEMKKQIFYRHIQLTGQEYINHGAGLGLSIVSALIKGLNGEIWLESELNKGSTFYFSLPNNGI